MPPVKKLESPKEAKLPKKAKQWMVPCSWLLAQASKQLALGNHNMFIGSDGKDLYIQGFAPPKAPKKGQVAHSGPLPVMPELPPGSPPVTWGPVYAPMLGPGDDEQIWLEDWPEPKGP